MLRWGSLGDLMCKFFVSFPSSKFKFEAKVKREDGKIRGKVRDIDRK